MRFTIHKNDNIAHVMQDITWYINRSVVPSAMARMKGCVWYLMPGINRAGREMLLKDNDSWIKNLDNKSWGGCIEEIDKSRCFPWLPSCIRNGLRYLMPALTFQSWIRVFKGPRNWVFHGKFYNLPTILIFRLLGKKVAFINWAGPGAGNHSSRSFLSKLNDLKWRLCSAVFVLMSPEVRYFKGFLDRTKISVLPYPANSSEVYDKSIDSANEYEHNGVILVGNNALRMQYYPALFDKLNPKGWRKIICMLNYGSGGQWRNKQDINQSDFIESCRKKFGDAFYPWTDVLPYKDYCKVIEEACIYCCPIPTQSGLGAAHASIIQGKAVFLTGDNYEWFKSIGVGVINLADMKDLDSEQMQKYIPTKDTIVENIKALRTAYCVTYGKEYWVRTIKEAFGIK